MNRLAYLIVYTPQIDRMKAFYRDRLGLPVRRDESDRVEFSTAGATLVLQASPSGNRRGVEFRLLVNDVDSRVQELNARGVRFEGGVQLSDDGAVAGLWDSEGTMLSLMTPKGDLADGDGPRLATAIVNCRDLAGAKAFYRNVMGLHPAVETAWWVEFDTGDAHLSLHPRLASEAREHHHSTPLTWSIEVDDLMQWVDGVRSRGVPIPTAPHDTPYGLMADVEDPDGNLFIVHEPAPEDDGADDLLDDDEPHQAPVRAPGRARSKATSRVAVKAEHPIKLVPRRRRPSATTQAVAKVRGGGKERARLEPKKKADEKKAKVKPATNRAKKAAGERRAVQKRATATASRGKAVKRAAGKSARTGARRTATSGRGRR